MNKFLLLILSIYCVFCTMDECNESTDQSKCNSIDVEDENFYCFKHDHISPEEEEELAKEEESDKEEEKVERSRCLAFPRAADN